MHLAGVKHWGILVGALMLTAACSTQTSVQEPVSPTRIAAASQPAAGTLSIQESTPAGAAVVPADSPIKDQPAPEANAVPEQSDQPAQEPPAITVQAEVGYAVGNRVPDFELTLADGSTFSYQDIISRGEPVFLFFTASW